MANWLYDLIYGEKDKRIRDLVTEMSKLLDKDAELEKANEKLHNSNHSLSMEIIKLSEEITRLDEEINLLTPVKLTEAKSHGKITLQEVDAALQALNISDINLSDLSYDLTSMTEAKKFCEETKVQLRDWEEETHDCDNFSYALMGYWSQGLMSFAFGIAWSSSHAFNIMFDKNKILWVCEPQTNTWTLYSEIRKNPRYKIVSVMM